MAAQDTRHFAKWLDGTNDVTATFLAAGKTPGLINLGGGLPDPVLFPAEALAEIAARVIQDHPDAAMGYAPINGLPKLRSLIADRLSGDRLTLTADNVLITSGSAQALDLIGKTFVDPGDPIAVQYPTYLGALDAFRPRVPEIRNVDLQDADVDWAEAFAGSRFVYTVPNFSNPTGKLIDSQNRAHLLDAAAQAGAWLVEDDPYGTLHLDSAPVPSMLSMSATPGVPYDGPCIYLGSLSKQLSPGLRIGWVVASAEVIEAMSFAKQGGDMCTSGLTQSIAYEAFASGLVDRTLPKTLELYRTRRDALHAAMSKHLSDLFEWECPKGGMFIWARAKDAGINTDALVDYAMESGVFFSPSSAFDSRGLDQTALRLNFTFNTPEDLEEGMKRLSAATRAMLADQDRQQSVAE